MMRGHLTAEFVTDLVCWLANVFLNGLRIHVNLGAVYGLNKVLKGRGGSIIDLKP